MSDMDRFTEFLLRHGAAYHAPPETPRETMWGEIERAVAEGRDGSADTGDPLIVAAGAYHEPPAAPADDMWGRIEAAWALRSGAPEGAREAGLDELAPVLSPPSAEPEIPGRRRAARWATGLAVAASLIVGIAIGRSSLAGPDAAGPAVAAGGATSDTVEGEGATSGTDTATPPAEDAGIEPLESGLRLAADEPGTRPEAGRRDSSDGSAERPAGGPGSRDVALRYATARHMGRAETLLLAFQAGLEEDDTPELAAWARRLLGETRLLLDSSDSRPAGQRALLEELELVLAQIAGLSPEAPEFERDLIAEGIERQGTIARLRAATPAGSGPLTGT